MPIGSTGRAPYAPPAAVIQVIEHCRGRGFPTAPFSADVLVKIGVSESLGPRTLGALRLLDLVDDDGRPTPAFEDLRKAPETDYRTRFEGLVKTVYASVFEFRDPTDPNVRDAFREYVPHGQQERMVTLFLGLCEYAGIIDAPPKRAPASPRRTSEFQRDVARRVVQRRRRERERMSSASAHSPDSAPSETSAGTFSEPVHRAQAAGSHPMIQGLLRELPPIGTRWADRKRSVWLEAQAAVFNLLYQSDPEDKDTDPD